MHLILFLVAPVCIGRQYFNIYINARLHGGGGGLRENIETIKEKEKSERKLDNKSLPTANEVVPTIAHQVLLILQYSNCAVAAAAIQYTSPYARTVLRYCTDDAVDSFYLPSSLTICH